MTFSDAVVGKAEDDGQEEKSTLLENDQLIPLRPQELLCRTLHKGTMFFKENAFDRLRSHT
jgi:hypothetical protein